MFIEVTRNSNRTKSVIKVDGVPTAQNAVVGACNKFRVKPAKFRLFQNGIPLESVEIVEENSALWLVGFDEVYQGPSAEEKQLEQNIRGRVTILDGADVWIDPEAIEQVHNTVRSSAGNITRAVGMPDLHHGPTGVAILANQPIPKLPGYDIGCGMALFGTRIPATLTRDAVARRMGRLDLDFGEDPADPHLGTIGGGNHFAELLRIDESVPVSEDVCDILDPRFAVLLVHSGSRGHGERVFSEHANGADLDTYMREHEALVDWARRNRATIARRFLSQFSSAVAPSGDSPTAADDATTAPIAPARDLEALVDIAHNWIERLPDGGGFLHRKGAAPARPGALSLLPGSRATASYVLACPDYDGTAAATAHLASLAHGAGRRLSRADARRHAPGGGAAADATSGGTVVCGDRDLLAEEGAHAYKDVEAVVSCMVARGMCRVAARLLPMATYKTRGGL